MPAVAKGTEAGRKVGGKKAARKAVRVSASPRGTKVGIVKPEGISSVMKQAAKGGLLGTKDTRIAGRISARLIAKAKARTGLESDSELIEFALANLALEDEFPKVLESVRGTVSPHLDLEF